MSAATDLRFIPRCSSFVSRALGRTGGPAPLWARSETAQGGLSEGKGGRGWERLRRMRRRVGENKTEKM